MKLFTDKEIIHFSQLNNTNEPFAACFPTSLAMALRNNGYQWTSQKPLDDYIFELANTKGSVYEVMAKKLGAKNKFHQYPDVMIQIANDSFKAQGINLKAKRVPYDLTTVKKYIDKGVMIVCGTYITSYGHMICISGYTEDSVVVNDPYGNPNTGYKFNDNNKLDDGNKIVLDKKLLPKLNYLIVFD